MATPYAEMSQPTEEHVLSYDSELIHLSAGVFTSAQIAVVKDPEATEFQKLQAIGQAMHNDHDMDFRNFLEENHDYGKDTTSPTGNLKHLVEGTIDYITRQEVIQWRLDDPEFIGFLSPSQCEAIEQADIELKQTIIGNVSVDYLSVKTKTDDLIAIPGLLGYMRRHNPQEARVFAKLPLEERYDVLAGNLDEFIEQQAKDDAISKQHALEQRQAELIKAEELRQAQIELAFALEQEEIAADKLLELVDDKGILNKYLLSLEEPIDIDQLIDTVPVVEIVALVEEHANTSAYQKYVRQVEKQAILDRAPKHSQITDQNRAISVQINVPNPLDALRDKVEARGQKASKERSLLPNDVRVIWALTGALVATAAGISVKGHEILDIDGEGKSIIAILGEDKFQGKTKLLLPSAIANEHAKIAPNDTIPKKYRTSIIERGAKRYVLGAVANASIDQGESKTDDNSETRRSIAKIDDISLRSLNLLQYRPGVSPSLVDTISKLATNVMLEARYPGITKTTPMDYIESNSFHNDILKMLEDNASNDPGMKQYTPEQRATILNMQAAIIDKLTPQSARADVATVFVAILAKANNVLQEGPPKKAKPRAKKSKRGSTKTVTRNYAVSPAVGRGMSPKARKTYKRILVSASKKYNTSPNFIASFYYAENARTGDSRNNADSAVAPAAAGDGRWREPAAPYGKGLSYGTNPHKTAGAHQFIPETWKAYGVDANGDGRKDRDDLKDSVYGAAKYMADVGGTKNASTAALRKAAFDYNRSQTYVQSVMNTMNYLNKVERRMEQPIKVNQPRKRTSRPNTDSRTIKGAKDLGMHTGYANGRQIQSRLYAVKGFKSTSQESTPGDKYYIRGANGNVIVGARAVKRVTAMYRDAKADGHTLRAVSSFRINIHQTDLWRANPNRAVVAPPGLSHHQNPRRSAVDFVIQGPISAYAYRPRNRFKPVGPNNPRIAPGSSTWQWLRKNAGKHGYVQYYNEPWHWAYLGK